MTWISRWKNISTKILQLQEVSRAYFDSINSFGVDHYGIGGSSIIPAARDLFSEVMDLKRTFPQMPPEIMAVISKLEKNFSSHHKFTGIPGVGGAMVHLGIFNSEMNFHLKDNETIVRDRVKLAFLHLQRTLMVDEEVRKKWQDAFREGETALAKLGATHLLSHGLWAFHSGAEHGRKDVVFETPIKADEVQAVGACLVLTEWRKVQKDTLAEKSKSALTAARQYTEEPLIGSELRKEKYLLMVSENHLQMPHNVSDDDTRYVYLNLTVNPQYAEAFTGKETSLSTGVNFVEGRSL